MVSQPLMLRNPFLGLRLGVKLAEKNADCYLATPFERTNSSAA
jgi:hypothetical protein